MDGGGVSLASDTHDWMLVLEGDAGGAVHIAFAGNLGQGREPSFGRFGSGLRQTWAFFSLRIGFSQALWF